MMLVSSSYVTRMIWTGKRGEDHIETRLNLKEKPRFYPKHVQLALQFKQVDFFYQLPDKLTETRKI